MLLQQGKGAGIGAAFGSGASNTVFGSRGSGGFLFKLTGGLAILFFVTSMLLTYIASAEADQQPQGILASVLKRTVQEEDKSGLLSGEKSTQSAGQNSGDSDNSGSVPVSGS